MENKIVPKVPEKYTTVYDDGSIEYEILPYIPDRDADIQDNSLSLQIIGDDDVKFLEFHLPLTLYVEIEKLEADIKSEQSSALRDYLSNTLAILKSIVETDPYWKKEKYYIDSYEFLPWKDDVESGELDPKIDVRQYYLTHSFFYYLYGREDRMIKRLRKVVKNNGIIFSKLGVLDMFDKFVKTVRESSDPDEAADNLTDTFGITRKQADYMLGVSLRDLSSISVDGHIDQMRHYRKIIKVLQAI